MRTLEYLSHQINRSKHSVFTGQLSEIQI